MYPRKRAIALLSWPPALPWLQRYISTRPMFTDPKALAQGTMDAQVTDASSAITAMRSLNVLYKALMVSVRDEAVIMEQVFPAADAALARLITRVFEQRVQVGAHNLSGVS